MATIKIWIQLENRPWDTMPNNIDRMTGKNAQDITTKAPIDVSLKIQNSLGSKIRKMYAPIRDGSGNIMDALIYRRYKAPLKNDESDAWTIPDDRKVNPWDINEPDPTDTGTMGTIPGPVIECSVGDSVEVHFRNMDMRTRTVAATEQVCFDFPPFGNVCFPLPKITTELIEIEKRCHSLHPHGFVFKPTSDGAYPLSPVDTGQSIPPGEAAAWSTVPNFTGTLKQGDRVPPGGTFIYHWETFGWPSTTGVWLYHDHSICDMDNVGLGAIGIIAIHNPNDTQQEVDIRDLSDTQNNSLDPQFLPHGSPNGSLIDTVCFNFPGLPDRFPTQKTKVLPGALEKLGASAMGQMNMNLPHKTMAKKSSKPKGTMQHPNEPIPEHTLQFGNIMFELDEKLTFIRKFCTSHYVTPPDKGLYLQLYHSLNGAMSINGRTYLGNTPTIISGVNTRMRFGVVGMGNNDSVHTFHIHGHRWIIPGPHGNTPTTIQSSVADTPVSQFEDTRFFGPANSFVFTINGTSGSFMRAGGPSPDDSKGEWHMHCHVLNHMMMGMMGSLLIIEGGELVTSLPEGVPCDMPMDGGTGTGGGTGGRIVDLNIQNFIFPGDPHIKVGDTVIWHNMDGDVHTVTADGGSFDSSPAYPPTGAIAATTGTYSHTFTTAGSFPYHCKVHSGMHGTITVTV